MPRVAARTPSYPPDFEREIAIFLHKRVGLWTIADAWLFLGEPAGRRIVLNEQGKPGSQILAFSDPTHRYRQVELDFDEDGGTLRSVFVYPVDLTWAACRRLWGTNVRAAKANKGRIFYSYQNRRLDVLVAPGGKVISLGLY
jgi:hypothetical protein